MFEVVIIIFTMKQASINTKLVTSGEPDHSISGTITDICLFIPGVSASLIVFLVFGTTKNWKEYRNLIIGGCGLKERWKERKARGREEGERDRVQGLEFDRLPSLNTTRGEEKRRIEREAEGRVRMFAREVRGGDENEYSNPVDVRSRLSGSSENEVPARVSQFHRTLPYSSNNGLGPSLSTGPSSTIESGLVAEGGADLVVQYERAEEEYAKEYPRVYRRESQRRFVMERLSMHTAEAL